MNSTPISISDSETPPCRIVGRKGTSQQSPGSSNVSRPISLTSKKFKHSLLHLKTPSCLDRVADWIDNSHIVVDASLPNEDTIEEDNAISNATFFRYDYKVNETLMKNNEGNLIGSIFNKSIPLCTSPITQKVFKTTSVKDVSTITVRNSPECDFKSNYVNDVSTVTVRNNSECDFNESYSNSHQSQNGDISVCPSIESRKKELCNYLKLMNHADKKEVCLSQYRRSTRVRNLEQKELKRRKQNDNSNDFSEESDENIDKSSEKLRENFSILSESLTVQSFNDLHMTVDVSKYPILQENETATNIFNFVMPPTNVLNEFNDFYHWIEPIIKKKNKMNKNQSCTFDIEKDSEYVKNKKQSKYLRSNSVECNKGIDKRKSEFNKFRKKYRDKPANTNEKHKPEKKYKASSESQEDELEEMPSSPPSRMTRSTVNGRYSGQLENSDNSNNLKSENSSPNIVSFSFNGISDLDKKKDENRVELRTNGSIEKENITVRVDYYVKNSENKQNKIPNCSSEQNLLSISRDISFYHGFNEVDIRYSREICNKFNKYLNDELYYIPEKLDFESTIISNDISYENDDHLNEVCESKMNNNDSDEEMEEIPSDTDTSSDCPSNVESVSSSDSNSVSVHENSNQNSIVQKCDMISPSEITPRTKEILPFNDKVDVQTLHSLLKKQVQKSPNAGGMNCIPDWDSDNSFCGKRKSETSRSNSHFISFDKDHGAIQSAIYVDYYLILIQEYAVSLWNQTALGNVLGAQNLWIYNGCTRKLILNKECTRKNSLEMVISTQACVVYVELWTKEHKSDIRQGPVADVFATVYFWIQKLNKMDRKVLQLENINGFGDDVQYVVLKPSLDIVVSWHSVVEDNRVTQIHVYTLAPDLQTIVNVRAIAKVEHYVSSLHNIEDCEELLMGCGEHKITLWNIEHGYIVASIELVDIKLSLSTLWVKCDRGILFTVQQCVDRELRLIAINGRSHSWKRLKSYKPPDGFERIQNVYIENGILIAFYEEGILCWKAQSGEQIVEEIHNETEIEYFPSGKYLIMLTGKNVVTRHALTHLLTVDD